MIHYYITSITYIKDPLPFVVKAYYEETVGGGGGGGGVVGHEKYGELLGHVIVKRPCLLPTLFWNERSL